jgi:2,5-diamino-6-(ribosylamino)-4(3H)-pyrimidinone 5'-phosphate reductase
VSDLPGGRPRVIANCAISLDGKLAFAQGKRARLSGAEDLARVQRLRTESDAILVGVGTVLLDDPSLRVHWELLGRPPGADPLRVVLDSRGRMPSTARLLDGSRPTLVAVGSECTRTFPAPVEVHRSRTPRADLPALLAELARRGIRQVMVEGGSEVLASFLRARLVDSLTVYVAPLLIGGRTAPSLIAGPETPDPASAIPLTEVGAERVGEGTVLTYAPGRAGAPL